MPYIHQDDRAMIEERGSLYFCVDPGELNYMIARLVDLYLVANGLCYATLNDIVGVLECQKLEVYRRIAAPYEDRKIEENGDVYNPVHITIPAEGDDEDA